MNVAILVSESSPTRSGQTKSLRLHTVSLHAHRVLARHLDGRKHSGSRYLPGSLRCENVCNYRRISSFLLAPHLSNWQGLSVPARVHGYDGLSKRTALVVVSPPTP